METGTIVEHELEDHGQAFFSNSQHMDSMRHEAFGGPLLPSQHTCTCFKWLLVPNNVGGPAPLEAGD